MPGIKDLLSIGTLVGVQGGHWSGMATGSPEALVGKKLPKSAAKSFRIQWVLMPSEQFRDLNRVLRQAYTLINNYAMDIPISIGVRLRMVSNEYLNVVTKEMGRLQQEYNKLADTFSLEQYPGIKAQQKKRLMKEAEQRWSAYKDMEGMPELHEFLEAFDAFLESHYPTPRDLRRSMYLSYGSFNIETVDLLDQNASLSQAVGSMVSTLRDKLRLNISKITKQILSNDRYGDKALEAGRDELQQFLFKNLLGDDVIKEVAVKALDTLTGDDARGIRQRREEVATELKGILSAVDEPTTGELTSIQSRLESMGQRRLKS